MLDTLLRAGAVLDLFTEHDPEWGATAAAEHLGIAKSLAHEELSSLSAIGLLQRVEHGRYRLGWRTLTLASELLRSSNLSATITPITHALARDRKLAVAVMTWERRRLVCINSQRHQQIPALAVPQVGHSTHAGDGAADRVLLAARPVTELKCLWGEGLLDTRHRSFADLADELAETRRRGWAAGTEIRREGWAANNREARALHWVAAPVRDSRGKVVAAISLAHPPHRDRLELDADVRLARAAAVRITRTLCTLDATPRIPRRDPDRYELGWTSSSSTRLAYDSTPGQAQHQ